MIISRTPLRVSLFGGGSDLPAYYRRHGGAVLSTAIDKSVYVTVSRKFDDAVRVSYSRTEEVARASEVEHPLVREALGLLGIDGGVEITSVADIPSRGAGLGSSSAFTVGLLNALHAYQGRHAPAARLAEESCHIELERCGEPIGKQDQYAAAFGGFNFIRFHPDDRVEVTKVVSGPELVAELERRLLFFYTGVTRSASSLLGRQSAAVAAPGAAATATGELACLAGQAFEAVCRGDLDPLGPMLDAAWRLKKGLGDGVSTGPIDAAYDAARAAGAEGGKLLGAGGGGFLMFLAPPGRHDAVRAALAGLRETPFRFARQGSSIIFVHD
ncbi:MAG TPA: kinase [Caulobacteraceae bacterium]|jgi:D-glycero-alpha-D-manno-heptose-7-phosphate kinase